MDVYKVVEVLYEKSITWESQDYKSAREAKKVQKEKQERNQNPDVSYRVKRSPQAGVMKTKESYI